MKWYISTRTRLGLALVAASAVSTALWAVGAVRNHSWEFWYFNWNLALAWVSLLLAVWLSRILRTRLWSSWLALVVTALFVVFLPNTFYLTTDIIHLQEVPRVDLVYDVIVFAAFIMNAFLIGLIGLYMLHIELRRRLSPLKSWAALHGLILLAGFAVYIGRDLRWNTWDIVLNPASILFEISDRLLAPAQHPEVFSTTLGFFVLIASTYAVFWYLARLLRQQKTPE